MPSHGHPDRTPSLRLYLDDGTWYCFACSEHAGDVVQWVQQTESVDWHNAIEILDSGRPLTNAWAGAVSDDGHRRVAAMPGTVEMADPTRTLSARIQQVLDAAWDHCTIGPLHARAVIYLAGRHIDATVL
jgi:DNA primase